MVLFRKFYLTITMFFVVTLTSIKIVDGQTLNWGSSLLSSQPLAYDSRGNAASNSLTWTVGYFANGFIPTTTNHASWWSNYVIVDTETESATAPYSISGYVADVGSAAMGKQLYIFAYNDPALIGTPQGEVVLLKQNGVFLEIIFDIFTFDIEDNPLDESDDPFTVIWGQVDRSRSSATGLCSGGGFISQRLADTSTLEWELQSATWVNRPVIPFEIATWAICNPTLRGNNDDADADGRPNLFEYASGTSMTTVDTGYDMVTSANPTQTVITLPSQRKSDVRYTLQYNDDLGMTWHELASVVGNSTWQTSAPLFTSNLPNNLQSHTFTTPTGTRGFFRMSLQLITE